jgi:hypothetical protein
MHCVRYRGFVVAVDHPAGWIDRGEQIVRDLIDVLTHPEISRTCLRHLIDQRQRLIRGAYESPDGRGCLMHVLTERLTPEKQVRNKRDLARLFGRPHGRLGMLGYIAPQDSPEYQPAKWLVRLVDGQICREVRRRYGRSAEFFDYGLVLAVASQVLAQREAVEGSASRKRKLPAGSTAESG